MPQRPHSPSLRHALAIGRFAARTASISSVPAGTHTLRACAGKRTWTSIAGQRRAVPNAPQNRGRHEPLSRILAPCPPPASS